MRYKMRGELAKLRCLRTSLENYDFRRSTYEFVQLESEPFSEMLPKIIAQDSKATWLSRHIKMSKMRPLLRLLPDYQAVTGWDA